MIQLEVQKKKIDIARLECSIMENEFKINERLADIDKIESTIVDQKKLVEKLKSEVNNKES